MRKTTLFSIAAVAVLFVVAFIIEEHHGLLDIGDQAPNFTAMSSDGASVSLSKYLGKKNVVLFLYPKDFTAGCTAEVCSIRDGFGALADFEAVVFGVSTDGGDSHEKFRNRYSLPFRLIADTDRSLTKAFGVERLGGFLPLTKRVTYIIDKEGVIRLTSHHEIRIEKHLEDVMQTLRSLH